MTWIIIPLFPLALTSVSITVLYIVALDVLQIAREQFGEKGRG